MILYVRKRHKHINCDFFFNRNSKGNKYVGELIRILKKIKTTNIIKNAKILVSQQRFKAVTEKGGWMCVPTKW